MPDVPLPLDPAAVQVALREFARERDWEQFHAPKNLAMSLAVEAGELLEIFQWLGVAESADIMADPAKARAVRDELADVLCGVLRLADVLGIELGAAVQNKLARNAAKYPAHLVRGSARKYSEYGEPPPPASPAPPAGGVE